MTRRKQFDAIRPGYDAANPPAGVRLELGVVAAALKVSLAQVAGACGINKTAAFNLLMNNWPARMNAIDTAAVRMEIEALLAERGATSEQLAHLWHAHGHAANRHATGIAPMSRLAQPVQPQEEPDMLLPKQSLSPQARKQFHLFTNPFEGEVVKDDQMFNGDEVRFVREAAWQCSQVSGFAAIVGESGAGKTTIMADLEERIARAADPVILIRPSVLGMEQHEREGSKLRAGDILHAIITRLAPQRTVPQTIQPRTLAAHKALTASAEVGNNHLLLIEEAHGLPDATLKHLKRLHELRVGRKPLLGILLIAQTELKTRLEDGLRDGTLREVAQRCEVLQLLPLDNELGAYLACRAKAAGAQLDTLIDAGGIDKLRERLTKRGTRGPDSKVSMCYPLAVNNMLTAALNKAAELGAPLVNADVMKQV